LHGAESEAERLQALRSELNNGLTLPFLPLSTSPSLSSASVAAALTRAALKYLKITDITPFGNSDETAQNSEPSLAVNSLDPRQIIAGAFGTKTGSPYFERTALLRKLKDVFRRHESQPVDRVVQLINPVLLTLVSRLGQYDLVDTGRNFRVSGQPFEKR
jgi:hypothetical protein